MKEWPKKIYEVITPSGPSSWVEKLYKEFNEFKPILYITSPENVKDEFKHLITGNWGKK